MEGLAHLEQEIERKRSEMYKVSGRYGLESILALEKSQELDMLLNNYQKQRVGVS